MALIEHRGNDLLSLPRPADFASCHHLLRTVPEDLPLDALARRTVALIEAEATAPPRLYDVAGVAQRAQRAPWASFPFPWLDGAHCIICIALPTYALHCPRRWVHRQSASCVPGIPPSALACVCCVVLFGSARLVLAVVQHTCINSCMHSFNMTDMCVGSLQRSTRLATGQRRAAVSLSAALRQAAGNYCAYIDLTSHTLLLLLLLLRRVGVGGWLRKRLSTDGRAGVLGLQSAHADAMWRAALAAVGAVTVSAAGMMLMELNGTMLV